MTSDKDDLRSDEVHYGIHVIPMASTPSSWNDCHGIIGIAVVAPEAWPHTASGLAGKQTPDRDAGME